MSARQTPPRNSSLRATSGRLAILVRGRSRSCIAIRPEKLQPNRPARNPNQGHLPRSPFLTFFAHAAIKVGEIASKSLEIPPKRNPHVS